MKPMRAGITLLALLGSAAVMPLAAAERLLVLDPEATSITFALKATLHKVRGRLHATGGEIRFDLETGAAAGEMRIDARRAETGRR